MKSFLKFLFVFKPQVHALDESAYAAIAGQQFKWWVVRRVALFAVVAGLVASQAVR